MLQLYVLSILCNGLGGYMLFAGHEGKTGEKRQVGFYNPVFHLVLGILCAVTGFLKLLASFGWEGKPGPFIFGDLVPAAAGIIAGIILIFGIYRRDSAARSTEAEGSLDRAGVSLLRFRKLLGLLFMAVALVHFLIPQALFL